MDIKMVPYNTQSTVLISGVSSVAVSLNGRASNPMPPGKVQVNGDYWPAGKTYPGGVDAVLTWAHRSRAAGMALVPQDAASTTSTPEGSYKIEVLINGAVVSARTQTISGASFTYTFAQRQADNADLTKPVQFRITPVSGSLTGTPRVTDQFVMQS